MTNNQYLQALLDDQNLSPLQLARLKVIRLAVEQQVSDLKGADRFYYGGSYGKDTMIREKHDLDIVVYWASDSPYTLKGIYSAVGRQLRKKWASAAPKNVGWRIQFAGGLHVDVVPGRAMNATFRYANLYRRDTGTSLQTSIKVHIDTVRDSGRRDAIRLMKLWRVRKQVPWGKALALELMTIEGCKGVSKTDLERQLAAALQHIYDNILRARIVDPANQNNVISEELTVLQRLRIRAAAKAALAAPYWSDVFSRRLAI